MGTDGSASRNAFSFCTADEGNDQMTLEKTHLKLGFVPLCDAAPLIVAKERGFFAEQGLEVDLMRQASWATLRDKVAVGSLDGAHMLATLPISTTLGLGNMREPLVTALALSLGGNAITVSHDLHQRLCAADPAAMAQPPATARALKEVIAADRRAGRAPLTFATVYPFSTHSYELRLWLAAAGIDPDQDVRLVVVPPPQMVSNLSAGAIDGYCVGEPWNSLAVSHGLGRVLITSRELWGGRVEKVLGVRQAWADEHPQTLKALIKALLLAAQWADRPENRGETADILARPGYLHAPLQVVRAALAETELLIFHRHAANFPWRSQALWYLAQMRTWGQLRSPIDLRRTAEQVFRADLYRLAALELHLPVPLTDDKDEGGHTGPWTLTEATQPIAMGADAFFDGSRFDPRNIAIGNAGSEASVTGQPRSRDL